jgi:hypothetical protein
MESISEETQVLAKKINGWDSPEDNFVATGEITVTITLSEYRNLIKEKATKDAEIQELRSSKYSADEQTKAAKAEIAELKEQIVKLKSLYPTQEVQSDEN